LLENEISELKPAIPLTIGNFCGGFKDLREIRRLIQRQGIDPRIVTFFRYRGGGQPGSMMIRTLNGEYRTLPYPNYANLTGIRKHYRCRVCVDATAELSDFACGDAWIDRFLSTQKGWSILMTRSETAEAIIKEMLEKKLISFESISVDELKMSQNINLTSKKTRQSARRRFSTLIGLHLPEYDGGYPEKLSQMMLEIKIFISHLIFDLSEKVGCYPLLAKILRRKA
jgi:coenzyme F420 hydrogenase subunit beta